MDVVITGSTKGLGLAMARRFLEEQDRVLICSRTEKRVDETVQRLQQEYPNQVIGSTVDVRDYQSVKRLAKFAYETWGKIDFWINNAGVLSSEKTELYNLEENMIDTIISTNLTGSMYGCKAAIQMGKQQQSPIQIFNVDGLGSDGRVQQYHTVYGTTKRAIPYLSKALDNELQKDQEITNHIGIHTISPGMVLTDLLVKNSTKKSRRIFNILAEKPATVADYLVPRIRDMCHQKCSGRYIKFLTKLRVVWRFLTFWRYQNRFFDDDGNLLVEIEGATLDQ